MVTVNELSPAMALLIRQMMVFANEPQKLEKRCISYGADLLSVSGRAFILWW